MKRKYILYFLVLCNIIIFGCSEEDIKIESEEMVESNGLKIDPLKEKIKAMDLDEKIGQLMILGFNGNNYNIEIQNKINELKPSGFILFSKNIKDYNSTLELLNKIKVENQKNSVPLFLSIDEDGGLVSRVPKEIEKLPKAEEIGKLERMINLYDLGEHLGEMLKSMGFNMNFAPVLDVNSNENNPVIGSRSYGGNGEKVFRVGSEILSGMNKTGVIGCVKHFPGHGDTELDSHKSMPVVTKSIDDLKQIELYPFEKIIDKGVDSIMISHILYTELDLVNPASLSLEIKENLLRGEYDYKGVILSDDMTMGAISKNYNIVQAAIKFIETGGDLVLLCHGDELGYEFKNNIIKEIENNNILIEEIDEKVYRILKLKEKYELKDKKTEKIDINILNGNLERILE